MQRICTHLAFAAIAMTLLTRSAEAAIINVPDGGDLQAALNQAQPGDTVVLQAGSRYVGQFYFPAKSGTVTLTSSGPLPDRRIREEDGTVLATIASGVGANAFDLTDSRHWTIDGIRFEPNAGGYGEVITVVRAEHIVLRRLLFVVPSDLEQKRFVLGNGRHITLTQSHCAGVWRSGQDSQCFAAWDGAGPYTITDNFLEAAGENVMFGGADSTAPDTIPADILVEDNFMSKRLEWKGQPRGVKNLFELKAARRVTVRRNVFERNWVDAQGGTAILFTPRNQGGTAPWTVVEDVLFEHNIVRDTPTHLSILGYDSNGASQQTTRITIRQNLFLGSGGGRLALIGNEAGQIVFDHNTYVSPLPSSTSMVTLYAEGTIAEASGATRVPAFAADALTFTNNLLQFNAYGVHSSVGLGAAALTAMTRTYAWANNVLAGGYGSYPPTTTFLPADEYPAHLDADYYLVPTSAFKSMATDGTDIGWNRPGEPEPEPDPGTASIAISTSTVPNGRTTVLYEARLTAEGGSGTFTWSLESGGLPDGLTLNRDSGAITGTPASAGDYSFTVQAVDAGDATTSASRSYTITISPPVRIVTTSLPGGQRQRTYSAEIVAADAVGAVKWSVPTGSLPAGLTLNTSTGVVSGKPREVGTFTVTVQASDSGSSDRRTFTIQVANR